MGTVINSFLAKTLNKKEFEYAICNLNNCELCYMENNYRETKI